MRLHELAAEAFSGEFQGEFHRKLRFRPYNNYFCPKFPLFMKRKAFFSMLLGASLLTFNARQASAKITFTEYTMPNGLHVILQEDHSTPIVAVSVMYHVGSKNEDPE